MIVEDPSVNSPFINKTAGIDPREHLFDTPRKNEDLAELSSCISCLWNSIFCFCLPLTCCSNIKVVKPMHDTIVSKCGVVTQVLKQPGPYCIGFCCTETEDVYMGLNMQEIKSMGANDLHGSPLVVSAQFVYRINDSIAATYKTSNLSKFLHNQAESALRIVVARYPYDIDSTDPDQKSNHQQCLRKPSENFDFMLVKVLQELVGLAGITIESFRLINVGYDPKMEKLLLARQEAQAEVTARVTIAEGTSGIIEETLSRLRTLGLTLTEAERNKFATNLTLLLVNHGHTTLNIFDGGSSLSPTRI
jgi:regulator of protease activity HflC (stomatin/prohibitin superfamily)